MTAAEYFASHSLNPEFLKKFGWVWDDNAITIPIYDKAGNRLFQRYRHLTGENKFSSDRGSHPTIYPLHKIIKQPALVLCEGEPDCIRLWQEGIPAVTGTSGVKTFSTKTAAALKGKTIFLCLDNDQAGRDSVSKYVDTLTKLECIIKFIELPEEYKDVSDYFTDNHTKDDFLALTKQALTYDEWLEKNEPEEFAFEEGTELLERELPPEEWLVERVLPTEGFCFIFGAEATGKTFYTLTLAQAVASGTFWLDAKDKDGNQMFTVKEPKKVLIIDKENTKRQTQSRMKGLGMSGKDIYWLKYPHFFELSDTENGGYHQFALTASRKVKQYNISLVIIDSFTDVMVGNENAAGEVQAFFDAMRELFPRCSILVLHHESKPAPGVSRTAAQRARGSTNIMAQANSAFRVEALSKSKTEFVLEQTKARDAEKLNKFLVELQVEPDSDKANKTVVTAIKYKGEVSDPEMKIQEAVEVIEGLLKTNNFVSRQQLLDDCQAAGISRGTMDRAIKQMIENNMVDSVPDKSNKSKRNYVWIAQQRGEIYEEE